MAETDTAGSGGYKMKAAVLENNVVINVIIVESLDVIPGLIDGTNAGIGDTWDGTQFIKPPAPPAPIPASITRRQAKLALLGAGLLDAVQPAIDAIPDATMRSAAQIDWDDALEFERNNATLAALAADLGLTPDQLDDLFRTAATL